MVFEWHTRKAAANLRKHDVSFDEAATALGDIHSITIADPDHSEFEERLILLGRSMRGRLLVIVHTERSASIRLISAREATRAERIKYEEA